MTDYDVIVLGTGAAGLVSALSAHDSGASVGLFERAREVGGTTALSGGVVWIANNAEARSSGVQDSAEEALIYLESLAHGTAPPELAKALIESGPELVSWLASTTPVNLRLVSGLPDKHPEHPGGKPGGGRALEPELFSFDSLGEWADCIVQGGLPAHLMLGEMPAGGATAAIDEDTVQQRKARRARSLGQALAGGLLKACLDRGIEPRCGERARDLIIEDGRVRGVRFTTSDGTTETRTARSVIIATGGFEWNSELVQAFLRGPMTSPASVSTNTGDGLLMAMSSGAALGNMSEAWWAPVIDVPDDSGGYVTHLCQRERTVPGSIMINRSGSRFTNEATNYNSLGGSLHALDARTFNYSNLPCWVIFDDRCLRTYGFLDAPAQAVVSSAPEAANSTAPAWLTAASSVPELAEKIDVDVESLCTTVHDWNNYVDDGYDPDFHRGESAYERFNGDRAQEGVWTTLGKLDVPPYYAAEIRSGCIGTKGGPRTGPDGEVLDVRGDVLPGLYAVGNAMAGATGMAYTGAGGTLGPAMTFGYRAGRRATK